MAQIADRINGFAGGRFGRDAHGDKIVEAVGRDWVVARDEDGQVWFASGQDLHQELEQFITRPGSSITFRRTKS